MKIEDKRKSSLELPCMEILDEILSIIPEKTTAGIRKIILLDKDYKRGGKASGRYCPVKGTNKADIELFFNYYKNFPGELKDDLHYQRFRLASTLCHELYHHQVRGRKRSKQPKLKAEEKDANNWADEAMKFILRKLYTPEEFITHRDRINGIIEEEKSN